jgi:hypothetical protein
VPSDRVPAGHGAHACGPSKALKVFVAHGTQLPATERVNAGGQMGSAVPAIDAAMQLMPLKKKTQSQLLVQAGELLAPIHVLQAVHSGFDASVGESHVPTGQSDAQGREAEVHLQLVMLSEGVLPAGQAVHAPLPAKGLKVPAGQATQLLP